MHEKRKKETGIDFECKMTNIQTSSQAKLQRLLKEIFDPPPLQRWWLRDTTFEKCGLVYWIVTFGKSVLFIVFSTYTHVYARNTKVDKLFHY